MPRDKHSKSPEELFAKSSVRPTTKYLHTFGCPVYVIVQGALQGGSSIPKWDARSRTGVYLGLATFRPSFIASMMIALIHQVATRLSLNCGLAEKAGLQEDRENEPTP
eukprot:scaffold24177_cov215-Cylindrotheca_fusiformis.AAC.1